MQLDRENLDVYQVSLEFIAWAYSLSKELRGINRHARDQLLRTSQSITLNIAGGGFYTVGRLYESARRVRDPAYNLLKA